jgi:hypothetical protein
MNIVEAVQIDETHFETLQPVIENYTEILFKINNNKKKKNKYKNIGTELCGSWKDKRSVEEIINDIENSRTGFGNREVKL